MNNHEVKVIDANALTGEQRRRLEDGQRRAENLRAAQENLVAMACASRPRFAELARWIVGTCKPGLELRIRDELAELGIESWCPCEMVKRPPRRGLKAVEIPRPLFRGYLFLRVIPDTDAFAGVLSASRLSALMGRDGTPFLLSEDLMRRLRLRVAKRIADQDDKPGKPWWVDRPATVTHGPFASFTATVRALLGDGDRVRAEVNVFGRLTPIELAVDSIRLSE